MASPGVTVSALFTITVSILLVAEGQSQTQQTSPLVVCYLGSWAVYRPSHGRFTIEDLDPQLCTHVIYAFTGLNETTNKMVALDPAYDIQNGAFKRVVALKLLKPSLKVSVAVGGWTEGSTKYSKMAATQQTRKIFIDSVIAFMREYGFDGLDLDWEYPANRGGKPEDKKNFVLLAKELRGAFNHFGWLLTAAVGAGKATVDTAYDLPALARELDYFHLMAYDYHGKWDHVTGHNAPLYARDDEPEKERVLNVEYSVDYYLNNGVPANKLVLGLGLYGRTFLLQEPTNPGIAAPTLSTAFAGPYTREDGFLGYNEICEKQVSEPGLWRVVWQKAHQAPYMFRDNMWVSYDDDNSLKLKVAFANSRQLAGMMVWSIDTDDFRGRCGAGRFPLLVAINHAFGRVITPAAAPTTAVVVPLPAAPSVPEVPRPSGGVIAPPTGRPLLPLPDDPLMPPSTGGLPLPPDHDVEYHNTLDQFGGRPHSSDAAPSTTSTALQSIFLFSLFIFAIHYLFRHTL